MMSSEKKNSPMMDEILSKCCCETDVAISKNVTYANDKAIKDVVINGKSNRNTAKGYAIAPEHLSLDFTNELSEKERYIMRLQEMKSQLEGENKCTICKAIEALQGKHESNTNYFPMLISFFLFLAFDGFGGDFEAINSILNSCLKTITEKKKEKGTD